MEDNITVHPHKVKREQRVHLKKHKPCLLWFTGLSGSGKSTIANELEYLLNTRFKAHTYLLDGDNARKGLNSDLGFSAEDREENIRRIGEVALLMLDAGLIVITAFISPFRKDREKVRRECRSADFIEVYVDCPIQVCETRDPKGLYKKARKGEINKFTGIDSPYEAPLKPEIKTDHEKSPKKSAQEIINYLLEQNIIDKDTFENGEE